jgi:hypothetical protein
MIERLEIFFVIVSAAREKEDRTFRPACGIGPVDPPDPVPVGSLPESLPRIARDSPAIESGGDPIAYLANTDLLTVVTF